MKVVRYFHVLVAALFLCAFAVCANAHFFASSAGHFIASERSSQTAIAVGPEPVGLGSFSHTLQSNLWETPSHRDGVGHAGRNLPDRGGVRVVDVVGSASTPKKCVRPTYRVQTSQYVARPKQHKRGEKIVGRVERWIDGDTCVFVADSGEKIRVRLWLVDAPESNQPGGSQATNYVRTHPHIGTGKRVLLYAVTTDKYGRTVGQLKGANSERFATTDLLASGYFWPDYISVGRLSKSQSDHLKSVFNATRADKRGIFVNGSTVEPWRWRKAHTH